MGLGLEDLGRWRVQPDAGGLGKEKKKKELKQKIALFQENQP